MTHFHDNMIKYGIVTHLGKQPNNDLPQ